MLALRVTTSAVLLALVALGGCSHGTAERGDGSGYVAMGDSYSAAPGVPTTDPNGPTGCLRSDHNYPSLLAADLGIGSFTDVTCVGASTPSLTVEGRVEDIVVPPQLDAVDENTSLVTIGIGANDLNTFGAMVGVCLQVAASDPTGAPCREQYEDDDTDELLDGIEEVGGLVARALGRIRDAAPDAQVVLVGYPQLVPASGTCAELPLAAGDYEYVHDGFVALDDALRGAADEAGADYVELLGPSEGHDICAGDAAWVEGAADSERALALHPFVEEQQAVADLIAEALD